VITNFVFDRSAFTISAPSGAEGPPKTSPAKGNSMIVLDRLDHLALTVADLDRTIAFYRDVLRMRLETFGQGRKALMFGDQKINLHEAGREFEPKALKPTRGSADLCFLAATPLKQVPAHLEALGVAIEEGPVRRTGATGPILSIYVRDPDGNLVEIANPITD
jgi:catechol 2,3-dioxygenase-like lactoylglutathione lyase family enzyme